MRKTLCITALGGVAALAGMFAMSVPSAASGDVFAGKGCNAHQIGKSPDGFTTAAVDAGPWVVPGATEITLICTISVGDDIVGNDGPPFEVSLQNTTAGSVGSATGTLDYQQIDARPVYICSAARWVNADRSTSTLYTAPGYNPSCRPVSPASPDPTSPPPTTPPPTSPAPAADPCPPGYKGVVVGYGDVGPLYACESVV